MYASTPVPQPIVSNAQQSRMIIGSAPSHSAIPPQTPASFLSFVLLWIRPFVVPFLLPAIYCQTNYPIARPAATVIIVFIFRILPQKSFRWRRIRCCFSAALII